MKVRGRRECRECGSRWSYYETGVITCPSCGSVRSVGVDDAAEHTNSPAEYDLTAVRNLVDERPLEEVAARASTVSGEYVRSRGFVEAGELLPLDPEFLAATELRRVGTELARGLRPGDAEELYFLELLRTADDGKRPHVDEVPDAFRRAYGLAAASAIAAYQRDLRTYLDDHPDTDARTLSGRIRDHRKRIEALDGDVDPRDADRLVRAIRDLGKYVISGEESALVTADNWLSGIVS